MPRTITNQAALGTGYADEIANSYDMLAAQPTLQETGGVFTTFDANEQVLYIRNAPVSVFEPRVVFISLDDMVALDNVQIRVYYRIAAGGGLLLYDYAQYTGIDGGLANGNKLIAVELLPCRFGVEVSLQMTVGQADFPWSVVEEA
jgi:hypothetical protein